MEKGRGGKTNSEVIGEDEEKIDDAGGWDNASCLGSDQNEGCGGAIHWVLTALARSSAGVTGMLVAASSLRLQALRMFFMRGASWRFASAFCNEGTG